MKQTRRSFIKYSAILLGMVSFGKLSLDASTKEAPIQDYMGEHFDPDGWL
jgi:hypothetical protein